MATAKPDGVGFWRCTVNAPPPGATAANAPIGMVSAAMSRREQAATPAPAPPLLAPAGLCLAGVVGVGLLLGLRATWPAFLVDALPMTRLRPLHAGGTVALMLLGVAGLGLLLHRRQRSTDLVWLERAVVWPLLAFAAAGALCVALGWQGPLEYAPWPAALSLLPAGAFLILAGALLRDLPRSANTAPEAMWLVLTGLLLVPAGLLEPIVAGFGDAMFTRDLSVEWHATDTLIAGCNTALYGFGIAIATPNRARPLRSRWLFVLAAFCLVSTFGHHHYPSGQPHTIKIIALTASMLAAVSFLRHLRAVLRANEATDRRPAAVFLAHAEIWTLFSAGSGILLAVPQVYILTHGTYAVVAHTMGAFIGVGIMLLGAGYLGLMPQGSPVDVARLSRRAKMVSLFCALMVLDLLVAGVAEGVVRVQDSSAAVALARQLLLPMPLLGVGLALGLTRLATEVLSIAQAASRGSETNERLSGSGTGAP